ncbi:MAG: hypothetical protein K2Y22_05870 [Candidatus Obscuribacterales bacterium]|nr:hypothetical protein [Candidatus Obscuribacterales bacterium]
MTTRKTRKKAIRSEATKISLLTNDGRNNIYKEQAGLFITHQITGSSERDGTRFYDIAIQLSANPKRNSLEEVVEARFFLGPMFGDKVLKVEAPNLRIATKAYGPMLCTGEATLKDGAVIELVPRWIDFEHVALLEGKQKAEQELADLQQKVDGIKKKIAAWRERGGCDKNATPKSDGA